MTTPKPVMLANSKLDLEDLKTTAQQMVDQAWNEDKNEASKAFTRDLYKQAIFEVTMEALFGDNFFEDHYNPRQEELDV